MQPDNLFEEIPLMKPAVPPVADLLPYLQRILDSRRLTNGGPVHEEFERALTAFLRADFLSLFANGTLALMVALKALNLRGEVITTPFTSPATLQAIHWNNLTPDFADICPDNFTIDPAAIEAAITPKTCAILPVHVFGSPCYVEEIGALARKHNLKVIYDAAHAFGVEINGIPLCNYGDLSVLSFHATKVFNTIEGGAIVCHDEATKKSIDALKNTGIGPDFRLAGYGINAKMNELQAAFGLCQLFSTNQVREGRAAAILTYRELLRDVSGIRKVDERPGVRQNHPFLPVVVDPLEFGCSRDHLHDFLKRKNIHSRKYFFPLVSDFPEFSGYKTRDLPVARKIADTVLCLPIFHDISGEQIGRVTGAIRELHQAKKRN